MAEPTAHNSADAGSIPAEPATRERAINEYAEAFNRYWVHRNKGLPFLFWKRQQYLEELEVLRLSKDMHAYKLAYWDLDGKVRGTVTA